MDVKTCRTAIQQYWTQFTHDDDELSNCRIDVMKLARLLVLSNTAVPLPHSVCTATNNSISYIIFSAVRISKNIRKFE